MNTYKLSGHMNVLLQLWHRFHLWRATRKYRWIADMEHRVSEEHQRANALVRKHSQAPQMPLPFSDMEEQDHWMRGK
jgi:hypothetical protein